MLTINTPAIGEGCDRMVYLHPLDSNKVIKLTKPNGNDRQSNREIKCYNQLTKRKLTNWKHLPKYYGEVSTDKGKGFVVECVRDYDGELSKNLDFYISRDGLSVYIEKWNDFKSYFINEKIIVTDDITPENILVKKVTEDELVFMLIDALGDRVFINFLNHVSYLTKQKIKRRFVRSEAKLLQRYSQSLNF